MNFSFRTPAFKGAYTGRRATPSWLNFMRQHVHVAGCRALDVGCGGGIYSRALLELGAAHVTGVDSSEISLQDACAQPEANLSFISGDATALPFEFAMFDLIIARALIHHLDGEGLKYFVKEARRCLQVPGVLVVQDRTVEDALAPGTPNNPRGYLYEVFPHLRAFEASRRPRDQAVRAALVHAGFGRIECFSLEEERRVYADIAALREEVQARRGRSILHTLSDMQLQVYTAALTERLGDQTPIVEREPWSVWIATLHR